MGGAPRCTLAQEERRQRGDGKRPVKGRGGPSVLSLEEREWAKKGRMEGTEDKEDRRPTWGKGGTALL